DGRSRLGQLEDDLGSTDENRPTLEAQAIQRLELEHQTAMDNMRAKFEAELVELRNAL
ncbi:hypothetical protein HK405_003684, partial [Cladochytrium tenue]